MLPKSTRPRIGGATAASVLLPRAAVSCSFLILSVTAMAESPSATSPSKAPSAPQDVTTVEGVRVQPRGNNFAPNYAEEAAVQERLTIFNTQQDVLDAGFDWKLSSVGVVDRADVGSVATVGYMMRIVLKPCPERGSIWTLRRRGFLAAF